MDNGTGSTDPTPHGSASDPTSADTARDAGKNDDGDVDSKRSAAAAHRTGWNLFATILVCLVVAACGLVVLARFFGSDQFPLLALAALLPLIAAPLVLAVIAAVVLRRRLLAIVATALLAVSVLWLLPEWGIGAQNPAVPPDAAPVNVMTSNAAFGAADPHALVQAVTDEGVDVLVTQETTPTYRAALHAAGLDALLPHTEGKPEPGATGTMIWSRWPIKPAAPATITNMGFTNRRAIIQMPQRISLAITAVHTTPPVPGYLDTWRRGLDQLKADAQATSHPHVMLGDFNATRDHARFRRLLQGDAALRDAADTRGLSGGVWPGFTWRPSPRLPQLYRLDHVLVSSTVTVMATYPVTIPGSDHRAVMARLRIPAAQ